MHLLRRLRRAAFERCLPQLRWRLRPAADPAGPGMAAWGGAGQAARINKARGAVLQSRGDRSIRSRGRGDPTRAPLVATYRTGTACALTCASPTLSTL